MGICPSLSPEQRATKQHNKYLTKLLLQKLRDLSIYNFAINLRTEIPQIQNRYLFNEGILEDIDTLVHIVENNKSIKTESLAIETIEDELRNSCLIIEDEMYKDQDKERREQEGAMNHDRSVLEEKDVIANMHENTEYQKNLAENQSLVCQINLIYQRDFDLSLYHNALKLFLKWSSMFHEHFHGGFLKPVYRNFCTTLYKLPIDDLETIVDETSVFVQYMVSVYTEVYHLKTINASQNGSLFKNENVFNLIMAHLFKRTKIKRFIRKVIGAREGSKIDQFGQKLLQFQGKDIQFFGVEPKFQLKPIQQAPQQSSISMNQSTQFLQPQSKPLADSVTAPYQSCIKQIQQLCECSQTPITKLKLIVQISKDITSCIYRHYDRYQKQVPELDPDNLTGIIMYLIVMTNRKQLYEELKTAECFTTSNCLTCISGYYLNTFNAAIETLIKM